MYDVLIIFFYLVMTGDNLPASNAIGVPGILLYRAAKKRPSSLPRTTTTRRRRRTTTRRRRTAMRRMKTTMRSS